MHFVENFDAFESSADALSSAVAGASISAKAASKSLIARSHGQRSSIGDTELAIDTVQVDLHGAFGEFKPLRYFLVGQTFGYDPDDLAFTRSERVNVMVSYPG